jgi:predicted transposase YbfD/YdcC
LFIAICTTIAGGDGWEAMQRFGEAHADWFKKWLELPHGIPKHDVYRRVFERINPKEFSQSFIEWVRAIAERFNGDIVAIDGKTSRHSYDTEIGKGAIHMVSAWSMKNRLVLGQVKTDCKSNEITAIPELLKLLNVKGCIVTIDAMGCQKKIAQVILKKEGDFLFSLKGNQNLLLEDVSVYERNFDMI